MVQSISPSGEESFFKREDIKTMAKDLVKAKTGQVEKHRQDVGGFKVGYNKQEQQDKDILEKEKIEQAKKRITEQEAEKIQERKQKIQEIEKMRLEKIEQEEKEKQKQKKEQEEETERKKQEQEQKEIEKTKKILAKTPEELLVEKKLEIKQEFLMLTNEKKPLEQQKLQNIEKIQEMKILLNPILEKEEKIEEKKKKTEEKEKTVEGIEEKQKIEEKRWKIEEKRREVETERWKIEEKIEKINKNISRIDMDYKIILDREKELEKQVEDIEKKHTIIKTKREKEKIEKDIIVLKSELSVAIKEKNEIEQEISRTKIEFQNLVEQEKEVERKIEIVEEKEKTVFDTQTKREIEKQRWAIGDRRKEIEQKRASIEKQIKELEVQLKEKQWEVQKKEARENKMNEQIQEIDEFLNVGIALTDKSASAKAMAGEGGRTVPNDANTETTITNEKSSGEPAFAKASAGEEEEITEEEIEEPIEIEIMADEPASAKAMAGEAGEAGEVVFRPVSKKLSAKEKLWTRFIIIFLLLAIIASVLVFWYWYLKIEKKPESQTENVSTETSETTETSGTENILPVEIADLVIIDKIVKKGYKIVSNRSIDTIVIHSCYDSIEKDPYNVDGMINIFQSYKVASHYLIDRDGIVYRLVEDKNVAYHAGNSKMPDDGRVDVNAFSIGIELIYLDKESPNEIQYQSLSQLVEKIQKEYNISVSNIVGHKDIAPQRKTDPWNFDWDYFHSLLNL